MEVVSRELARRESAETALARHLDEQKALFVELNNRAVGKGRPAPYPDVGVAILTMQIAKRADGTFLVKAREKRLEEVDWDLSGHTASVRASRSYSERMGGSSMSKDETRLFLHGNMGCTVEVGEVSDAWRACL